MSVQSSLRQPVFIRHRAFSMVEVVLIVTVISIMAAIAVPRYANFSAQQRLTAAANRIKLDLGLAQRQARYGSAAVTVSFDVAGNSYTLVGLADLDRRSQRYTVQIDDSPYNAAIASADFGGDATVIFDGYGVPDSGGSVVIQIGQRQATVTLSATGVAQKLLLK